MRSQAHSPTAQWSRKAPQQSLLSTPIACSEWSQLDQGDQELFCISWGNLCQHSITPTWKGFPDVSVELPVFQSVTAVSCPVILGINGNNLAVGLPCLGFLKANLTRLRWRGLFWGPVQQQALSLPAFAADTFVGALLVPHCILC